MKQTLIVKLAPSQEQHQALLGTMERFNEACNYASDVAFSTKTFGQYYLHHAVYNHLREHFSLSAQMAVRAIAKVSESYKANRDTQHFFKPHSAMVYDQRILSWKGLDKVSILTLQGRQIIPIKIGAYQEARLDRKIRQTDLILRDGTFYLAVVVDAPEPTPNEPDGFLGIDLGIVNIASDSDGEVYSGGQVNGLRKRHAKLRSKLQANGSKQAKRLLVKRSKKEQRFATKVNHEIAKSIVARAKDTGRGIALEDLSGIRDRITVRKSQRRQQHSWAFGQLRQFIEYKARIAGVLVKLVDPRNTSRTCPNCGFVSKSNRKSQSLFSCVSCGFSSTAADTVAATNIGRRATVNWPDFSPVPCGAG